MTVSIPGPLLDAIREGRAVLFLGAGASYGAHHATGLKIPDGNRLRDLICDKFLNGDMKSATLIECSDFAIDSHDLNTFQRFVRDTFNAFEPADFQQLLPTFNWNAIFTTNYDLLVEKSYKHSSGTPEPVVYVKDGQKVDLELRERAGAVLLTKLHGSIDHYMDTEIPLALSSDQYVSVSKNRKMLFDRLLTLAAQFPVLFVGYRATDLHIKTIFIELDQLGQRRPRYFYVSPNIGQYQQSYLETRRTSCINSTFEDFIRSLDNQLSLQLRTLRVDVDVVLAPIKKHINVPNPKPSGDLTAFLSADVEAIYSTMPLPNGKDADFYEGIPQGFYAITKNLDVRRAKKTDTILSDVFFREETPEDVVELCVIKGAAGSGKSIFMRRLAWEATTNFDCLCLYHRRTGALRFSAIRELFAMTNARIFLFVDRAAYHVDEIEKLLSEAKASKAPLTIITAERHNEWNVRCDKLERFVTYEDEMTRLSEDEVTVLVSKMRNANALGELSSKTDAECKAIFEGKLNRQILVALHEATKGKSFEDIVVDEYQRIIPTEAQLLYLDICTFQRLGADLRAGLITRIGGVTFDEFSERLLKPLERVVFVADDKYGKDFLYRARHQRIAEIVFDKILKTQKDKFDILLRLLKGMNRDYSYDEEAFVSLMHGSTLNAIFSNADLGRQLLDEGLLLTNNNDFVLHQRAAFELQHSDGDPAVALDFINRALQKNQNKAKLNTKANALRRLAQQTSNEIRRTHYRNDARALLASIGSKSGRDFTLLLNLLIDELNDLISNGQQGDLSERAISTKVQEIEQTLGRAHVASPADPYVLQVEARYRTALEQDAKAFGAIRKAFVLNPSLAHIAKRLAWMQIERKDVAGAAATLAESLLKSPARELKFELAKLLTVTPELNKSFKPMELLEESFDQDDEQIMPRLYLLREYWRGHNTEKFRLLQRSLKRLSAPRVLRSQPNLVLTVDGQPEIFSGSIRVKEADYAFITPDHDYPDVFIHRSNVSDGTFDDWESGNRVQFAVGFSTRGAVGRI